MTFILKKMMFKEGRKFNLGCPIFMTSPFSPRFPTNLKHSFAKKNRGGKITSVW